MLEKIFTGGRFGKRGGRMSKISTGKNLLKS